MIQCLSKWKRLGKMRGAVVCLFAQGDRVLYGAHGVCDIVDVVVRAVDGKQIEYFVLEPLEQPRARYYVPTQNQAAVAKLRPIITHQELGAILQAVETGRDVWIEDENQRKQYYRELLMSGDRCALVNMVYMLNKRREAQLTSGRKLHLCDASFLKDAQKLLDSEFSLVLNMGPDEVRQYIQNAIEAR